MKVEVDVVVRVLVEPVVEVGVLVLMFVHV